MADQDQTHIASLRSGDQEGLREIYRLYLPRVMPLITRNGGTREDALDIFQDALMVLFEKTRNESFVLTSSFYTLLYGICRNLWGNRLQRSNRREKGMPEGFNAPDDLDLAAVVHTEEKRRIFWDAFRRLGGDCQRILELFFERVPMEEIAEAMGYASEGYAKKRKFQCKEHLVRLISADARYAEYQS